MNNIFRFSLVLLLILAVPVYGYEGINPFVQDVDLAYSRLNQIREQAGMTLLKRNIFLEYSAYNHAVYTTRNDWIGHEERPGRTFFSGTNPGDRTAYVGYQSKKVSENCSFGNKNSLESLDGLMSAIYHRFGFLDFTIDEVGIGVDKDFQGNTVSSYVYNMGNSKVSDLCQVSPIYQRGPFFQPCLSPLKINWSSFVKALSAVQAENPLMVVWPTPNDTNVLPYFRGEIPNPLPDLEISGYPISIQFNPFYLEKITLIEFRLFDEAFNQEVWPTRLLTRESDPNQRFTDLQFALFPMEPLAWNREYRAEARYWLEGQEYHLVWKFWTRSKQ